MKAKSIVMVFLIAAIHFSCNQNSAKTTGTQNSDSTERHSFFPVTAYILGQIKETESMPVTPLKIIKKDGKEDSVWMKKEDIRIFAEPFLHPVIDTENFKNLFKENSFLDQTINAITFSYEPVGSVPDSLQIKHWDVYIDPQKYIVNRIYIVKEILENKVLQTQQLTWRSGKWCKIITIITNRGKSSAIKEETMKWDFSE